MSKVEDARRAVVAGAQVGDVLEPLSVFEVEVRAEAFEPYQELVKAARALRTARYKYGGVIGTGDAIATLIAAVDALDALPSEPVEERSRG